MKAIFVRSPYSIVVDFATQVETKLELYLWNKPNVSPGTPTYTFSQLIPSTTQRTAYYNIANECQEFIENINPTYIDGSQLEQNSMWSYAKAISYYRTVAGGAWTQYSNETFICLYGYSEYKQGVNYSLTQEITMLNSSVSTQNIPQAVGLRFTVDTTGTRVDSDLITADRFSTVIDYSSTLDPYINVMIQQGSGSTYFIVYQNNIKTVTVGLTTIGTETLIKIPLEPTTYIYTDPYTVSLKKTNGGTTTLFSRLITPICEPKYTPLLCSFINKLGGWENLWLMKLSENSVTSKGTEYNISPSTFNYNIYKGQSKSFNRNGKKSTKTNTGWVDESTGVLITELLMSETILLNNEPVMLKGESQIIKQWVKDKNINYTLDFESKNNLINNVV